MDKEYLLIFTFHNEKRGRLFIQSPFFKPVGNTKYDTLLVYSNDRPDQDFINLLSEHGEVLVRENVGRDYGAFYDGYKRNTSYKKYAFIHDDVEIHQPNWLEILDEGFNLHPEISVVAPQVSVNLKGEDIPRGACWIAKGNFLDKIKWKKPDCNEDAYDQEMNLLPETLSILGKGIAQVGDGIEIMHPENYGPSRPEVNKRETNYKIMASETRKQCTEAVTAFSQVMNANRPSLTKLLYVGIAGDPAGGEYSPLFPEYRIDTFDADPIWKPDIVGDITGCQLADESYGAIVCVQVLEHVKRLWKVPEEMNRLLVKGGYAIVDCPFNYPYHAEPPSFGDYWRITKDGMEALFGQYFDTLALVATDNLTSCLLKKR